MQQKYILNFKSHHCVKHINTSMPRIIKKKSEILF